MIGVDILFKLETGLYSIAEIWFVTLKCVNQMRKRDTYDLLLKSNRHTKSIHSGHLTDRLSGHTKAYALVI